MLRRSIPAVPRRLCQPLQRSRVPRAAAAFDAFSTITRRHAQGGGPFQPLRPPSPAELGAPRIAKEYKKGRKWTRRILILLATGGLVYGVDRVVYASGFTRSMRTFTTGLVVALDYKINFRPDPWTGGTIKDLHLRNAERIFDLLRANGGLYMKIGQAFAMQSAILPPEFQKMFGRMFDDAPQDEWKNIERVIEQDFGKSVEEVFGVSYTGQHGKGLIERKAKASASVAQVHWARLPDGREVAIKIQKPDVAKQRAWDMWAFHCVTWIYSKWFDLPIDTLVPFITERLEQELDFVNEAKNSEMMRKLVNSDKAFKNRVYIPTVYHELTTKRILTTEWIEGVRLWDREAMSSRWLGGHGKGSPGAGTPLPEIDMDQARRELRTRPLEEKIKPDRQEWRGARGKGGLGVSSKEVMTIMVDLFSAQLFKWGVVHADPHPGNIFIRRLPNGKAELVLIDHGLYALMTPEFRHQYSTFWKALMTWDNKTIQKITKDWGLNTSDFFASATLMRPYQGGDEEDSYAKISGRQDLTSREKHFEMEKRMTQGVRELLANEDKWPKELIFIARQMRIVQGNNQYLGSPVNRVKMMGEWASRSLYQDPGLPLAQRARNAWRHILFKAVMTASDVAFYFFKLRQWLGIGGGMEDEMEKHMKDMAQGMGIELQQGAFNG